MIKKEISRREVEEKIAGMGDFVKMHFLNGCLKRQIDFDTRRFVLLKLGELYEERRMFLEAGKMIANAAPINPIEKGKVADLMKATEMLIKGGNFDDADITFDRAAAYCNEQQKWEIKQKRIELFKKQADEYIKKDKRQNALDAYEKLLSFNLTQDERKDAQKTLLDLYSKLGRIREYYNLRSTI